MAIFKEKRLENYFDEYINHCKIRGLSEATIDHKTGEFKKFAKLYDVSRPLDVLQIEDIENFIIYRLNEDKVKPITINTTLRTISSFLNWCDRRGYKKAFKITLLKSQTSSKETYSHEELKILLEKPNLKKVVDCIMKLNK